MARSRQVVVLKSVDPSDDEADGLPPLGDVKDVIGVLANYNTSPDGSPAGTKTAMGLATLFGPGFVVEIPTSDEEVRQFMVTMTDEDFAFPVLTRMCRQNKWTMMDPGTGQRLRF
jgi:hypothetical protein